MLNQSGNYFNDLENEKSLNVAKTALHHSIELNDDLLIAKSYNLIGLNFDEYLYPEKAVEYYEKGLKHANLTENDSVKQWLYNNLGNVYAYSKVDITKSILYYKEALSYAVKIKDEVEINYIKQNIASAYFAEKKYNIGKIYLDEISSYVLRKGQVEARMTYYSLLGEYYNNLKNDILTEKYYLKAVEISKENKQELIESNIADLYYKVSTFYAKEKDYEKAYYYLNQSEVIKDKVYNDDKISAIKDTQSSIELDEYKRQIDKIEEENKLYVKSLSINKTINILLFSLYIIIGILFILLFKNHKIRKDLNTTLEVQNSKLEIAKIKAEENANLKSQFVSTVTHEIRTPLYGIIGLIDLLVEENKEFKNNQKIKSLNFSANYLLMLINDVLQTNKLESKNVILDSNKFSVTQVFKKVINSLQYLAKQNNNKIEFTIDNDFPKYVYGDKTKFVQIIMNLITNALKFTNKGIVKAEVKILHITDKKVDIQINVCDNGIGIDEKEQKLIFNKFIQLNRKQTDYQGTGLGLYIVKSLVDILNGKIVLESKENVGTTIHLNLSFSLVDEGLPKISKTTLRKIKSSVKVLIVEDNKINQMVTKRILDKNDFITTVVENGFDAISKVEKIKFDIILMDINMPEIDGFETAIRIRNINPKIPIIALTATDANEIKSKISQSEIDEVIVKPFDEKELISMIYKQIKKFKKQKKE
ncbi:response regulator [uncultured Flavobacterium sp.]|uniref:tetratricopeptide repeat-containing hybrid sensor histidine kinase/response regulator n=1 Tax=uncultured Flavobacterium sp. TaxID=165435 RepID=UPI0030C7AB61